MTKTSNFPIGANIDLATMARNPYPIFQKLLANEPVSWVPAFNFWMVTRRQDVMEILRDAELFTMEPEGKQANPMEDTFGTMMLSIDGPRHKQIRDVFIEPYRSRRVRQWYATVIEEIAERLVADIQNSEGKTADLDKAFSDKLAIYTVVATLGLEVGDVAQFRHWYDDFAAAIGNVEWDETIRAQGKASFQQFETLVLRQIEHLQARPNQSVLSHIITNNNGQLTNSEIVSNLALTFFGGVETVSALLSNTIWALLTHPDQLAQVQQNPKLLTNTIEESLRWEAPVQAAMRFPTRNVVLHGVEIKRGEKIYCMLGAANRDTAVFTNPNQFDIQRPNADKHLSFAYGPHFCFGAPLARLEASIGLTILLEHLPNLILHPDYPTAPFGHEFRSPPTLYATW